MKYVNAAHIQDWVRTGRAIMAPQHDCRQFHEYLLTLQWAGAGIDWSLVPNMVLDLETLSDDMILDAVSGLPIASHSHLLALFSPDQPGIYCGLRDGLENVDYLFWKAPGVRFICGADAREGGFSPHCADFAEFRDVPNRLTIFQGRGD